MLVLRVKHSGGLKGGGNEKPFNGGGSNEVSKLMKLHYGKRRHAYFGV